MWTTTAWKTIMKKKNQTQTCIDSFCRISISTVFFNWRDERYKATVKERGGNLKISFSVLKKNRICSTWRKNLAFLLICPLSPRGGGGEGPKGTCPLRIFGGETAPLNLTLESPSHALQNYNYSVHFEPPFQIWVVCMYSKRCMYVFSLHVTHNFV